MNAPDTITDIRPLQELPKVELHVHLDCSLSFDVVCRLKPSVTREQFAEQFIAPAKCPNLAALLDPVRKQVELLQTEDALALAVSDLFDQFARDEIVYAEVRFAPLLHLEHGLTAERVVEVVDQAVRKAIARTGVESRIILCTLRNFGRDESMYTAELVHRFRDGLVVALDVAGDEAAYPLDSHVDAFQYITDRGMAKTAHAGEARGPESVRETLGLLDPARIGHGVRSIEDPSLITVLKERGVHLEVCPTSNVKCSISHGIEDHPIGVLEEAGVSFGISTDGRTLSGVSLSEEYRRLQDAFAWTPAHFTRHNIRAIDAAFLGEQVRAPLRDRIQRSLPDPT